MEYCSKCKKRTNHNIVARGNRTTILECCICARWKVKKPLQKTFNFKTYFKGCEIECRRISQLP